MQLFQQEYDDGIADIVASSASISYASIAKPCEDYITNAIKNVKALASIADNDLYYVQSILVTSNWNKNDDIFDKTEVWKAKNTPEDKPTNLEHDESMIIGHIVSNYPVTEDGILIDENTDINNLPNKYHILTGSVIYRAFSNPDLKDRSEKLIQEIQNGQKYVSMECMFNNFDYGLLDQDTDQYEILSRNNSTAYLTKYLRAYGGTGQHENYKIGRVLRNITFSGKGFVDKPANPDSIIFNIKDEISENNIKKKSILSFSGVSLNKSTISTENNTMSSENQASEELNPQEDTVVNNEIQQDAQSAVNVDEIKAEMDMKNKELESLKSVYEKMKNEKETEMAEMNNKYKEQEMMMKKQKEEMATMMEKMKAELDQANETIAAYKNKEEEMMKKEKKMKRMASLLETGLTQEEAEAAVEKFDNIDDDTFLAITSLANSINSQKNTIGEETNTTEETSEATPNSSETSESSEVVTEEVLDNVEVEETINLGIGGQNEDSISNTRAALVEFVSSRLNVNKKS